MKLFFYRKTFSKKPIQNIVSMGYTGKLFKNKTQNKRKFSTKSSSKKTVSKIVSMGYTRMLIKSSRNKLFP